MERDELIEKKHFIEDLRIGDSVSDVFLVRKIIPKDDPEVLVCDKTGEIKIAFVDRSIDRDDIMNLFKPGNFVFVRKGLIDDRNGEIKIYLDSLDNIEIVDKKNVQIEDLVPSLSDMEISKMLSELRDYIDGIENVHLKALLKKVFYDDEFLEKFVRTPSSIDHHHNYIGGNLEHTLNVVKICDAIAKMNKDLNRDILVTGAMLHDIGKSFEYKPYLLYEKTDEGILAGHIILGERRIREKINELRSEGVDFPEDLEMLLSHMILSHHGRREWGSPEVPKFLEALVLHYADLMDSQIKYHIQKMDEEKKRGKNNWTLIWDNDLRRRKPFYIGEV